MHSYTRQHLCATSKTGRVAQIYSNLATVLHENVAQYLLHLCLNMLKHFVQQMLWYTNVF